MDSLIVQPPHIVIVGAGFGGIQAANQLSKTDTQITVIDKHNYHLFQPLLYQVATAGLSEEDIIAEYARCSVAIKMLIFRMDEVIDFDFSNKRVITHSGLVAYDYFATCAREHH